MNSLTTIVAVYGAMLSTTLAILQLYRFYLEQKEKRPRVDVKISLEFAWEGNTTTPRKLLFEAANSGNKVVMLNSPSLLLPENPNHVTLILPLLSIDSDVIFPHELLPGRRCTSWKYTKDLARLLLETGYSGEVSIVAEFTDALDNSYKSEPFAFNTSLAKLAERYPSLLRGN
jgi:hypothetical protein